jgi:glycosyltransferase involved in cell wall biosynthesis
MDPLCGGPCQGIRNSIPALATLQCENVVVCSDDPQSEFLQSDDFVVHALGKANGAWQKNAKLTPWLMHNLIHFDSVIIHGLWLHHSYATWKAVVRHRSFHNSSNPKLFLMSHGMLDPWFQRHPSRRLKAWRNWLYWKVIEKHVVNGVDGLLFTCEQELLLARETFPGYRPKREINVGYGVTEPPVRTPEMDAAFRATTPELNGRPYLLFLSRIHPKKGVDLLLKAYASVLRNGTLERPLPETGTADLGPSSRFMLSRRALAPVAACGEATKPGLAPNGSLNEQSQTGRGEPNGMGGLRREVPDLVVAGPIDSEYARRMFGMAKELGLSDRVHFPGMLSGDAKWGAFYGCEAFVLPSHQENFGIAVAEALACSKPVLISNQVNIWREIESSGAGIVAADTEQGTIHLIERWCTMSGLEKESIGLKARVCYREHFDIVKSTQRMANALSVVTE